MVMSAATPPLAAMMTATRCNASRVVASPTGLASQRAARPVSPAGSRVRAISAASRLGVAVVSSQLDARADHIGADQRQQPGGDDPAVPGGGRGHRSRPPPDRERSPVRPAVLASAAGPPSLLPGLTWLGLEPVQHDADPAAPVLLTSPAGHGERRRGQQPVQIGARQPGPRPGVQVRARREPPPQRVSLGVRRPAAGPGRCRGRQRARSGAHHWPGPNSTFSDSAR